MNPAIDELVRSVVEKNSLSECSVDELEQLVSRFPYFGAAQFLLARKLKEENSPLYTRQSQRAILYFQDHLWFDYLSGDGDTGNMSFVKKEEQPVDRSTELPDTGLVTEPVQPNDSETIDNVDSQSLSIAGEPSAEATASGEPVATDELPAPMEEDEKKQEDIAELPPFKIQHATTTTQPLVFEPYHTVDYFASLGIRFKEEEKPRDRLGQQLKSFTEWLKTMKKLPDAAAPQAMAAAADDPNVTQMAERSITDRQIVTEAMAEVWEKQGNHQKAIDIYRKLSLSNPAKSSYFAAKIEHLKHL